MTATALRPPPHLHVRGRLRSRAGLVLRKRDRSLGSEIRALNEEQETTEEPKRPKRRTDSTDAVASFLTRRFGIGAGIAWLAVLAIGSLGEQIKTRLEVRTEELGAKDVTNAKEITLPSGVRYKDRRVGGVIDPLPLPNLVGAGCERVAVNDSGSVFEDSFTSGKQVVFLYGGRPLKDPLCVGLEEALSSMKAGGIREVTVPPDQGFGTKGRILTSGSTNERIVPGNATLKILVELKRVSIAP